jgi:predicted acylesterase/phospholipase RssA
VLKALYAVRGKDFVPRVVAGVSIGAINAALLVGARTDAMAALDRLWREKLCVDAAFTPESAPAPAAGENSFGVWEPGPDSTSRFSAIPACTA